MLMMINKQSYIEFRQDAEMPAGDLFREVAAYLDSLGPCDLLRVIGGLEVPVESEKPLDNELRARALL